MREKNPRKGVFIGGKMVEMNRLKRRALKAEARKAIRKGKVKQEVQE